MKPIIEQLEFNHHSVNPTDANLHGDECLILNKCDGYHIAYLFFDLEDGEFLGFYDFVGKEQYKPSEFFVAWAHLPCSIDVSDKIGE